MYALCGQKHSTITVCCECKEHYCAECIDTQICGCNTVCEAHEKWLAPRFVGVILFVRHMRSDLHGH